MRGVVDRIQGMQRSGIRAIMDIAESMEAKDLVRLEVGQPHFPTPAHIVEAAHKAMVQGFTRYTPNAGLWEVREAVAEDVRRRYPHLDVTGKNIMLTHGGVLGLALSVLGLVRPGHKVLVPDPGWPNYTLQIIAGNATPLYYPLRASEGYQPRIADLERLVTHDTDAIILNSPSNPTGAVFDADRTRDLVDFARKHDLYVISDEVYDQVVYEGAHIPTATFDTQERVLTINSFSKTYSMTGWRLGYLIASEELCDQFIKLSEALIACPSAVSQKAAESALLGPQDSVAEQLQYYNANRDALSAILAEGGLPHVVPRGAFYMYLDISAAGMRSDEFAVKLAEAEHVTVAPGTTFGPSGEKYVRLSFCTDHEAVKSGAERIVRFVHRWA